MCGLSGCVSRLAITKVGNGGASREMLVRTANYMILREVVVPAIGLEVNSGVQRVNGSYSLLHFKSAGPGELTQTLQVFYCLSASNEA